MTMPCLQGEDEAQHLQPRLASPPLHLHPFHQPDPAPSPSSFAGPSSLSGSTPRSGTSCSSKTPKPPPISISPTLRRLTTHPTQTLSTLLNPGSSSSAAGLQLELAERADWDLRTGRSDGLAMRLTPTPASSATAPLSRDGGRDRWGNRWGIENHILSPVISERTEPTHTSVSSPVSTGSLSIASAMDSIPTHGASNPHLTPSNSLRSPPPQSSQLDDSQQAHHKHAMNLLNRKKIKNQITNRQRDLDVAHRQIAKRIERQKRQQMIIRRDEIAAQLIQNPTNARLVRDLGKLYLEFHHPTLDSRPIDSFRLGKSTQTTSRSEPSLKLAIHYLEHSIQLDNLDPLTWLYLAKAWSLLLAYPTEHAQEREQRLSNSSLAFRKAIVISSNLSDPSHQNIQQNNRFRLSYAQHLESIHEYKDAASILQDALELDEIDADCWWALGRMMELWALDTESDLVITKQERFERMKHSCEAYQQAAELQPEDSTIHQCKLNGEEVLERLKLELKAEEEAQAREQELEQDVALIAERIRGLNLSPFTNKVPPTNSIKPPAKSSSSLALKKLVAELREIPEFGKKVASSSSTKNPSPFPSSDTNEIKKSTKEPKERVMSMDSTVTQVESVVSSSPTPSHAVRQVQSCTGEVDDSSSDHFSPSSQTTHENSNVARGLESFHLTTPKNPGSDSSHISLISITSSTPDLSPTSTQSHDDVKMTIMSLTTASMERQNQEVQNPPESPGLQSKSHAFHSNSHAPPSPSTLPTSKMQSLSSRSCTSKMSSPRNNLVSMTTSVDCAQKEVEGATYKTSPHLCESNLDQFQQQKDEPKLLDSSTHQTTDESVNFTADHLLQTQSHQSNALIHSEMHQQAVANLPPNQHHDFHDQEQQAVSSKIHSPCSHHLCHGLDHQSDGKPLKSFVDRRGEFYFNPEDPLNITGQNNELLANGDRSPPPPQIPPRPKSICIQSTVPTISNSIPTSTTPVFHGNLGSESSLGIRLGSSPHLDHHFGSFSPAKSVHGGYQSPAHTQIVMTTNQSEQPRDLPFPNRSPRSDMSKRRTISLTSPIGKPSNERFSTNRLDHLSPSSSHHPLDSHLQHSCPVYDYSLIDSHLQSILEVDMKRKAELKEIKKQIRKTDEWAENQRRSIVEEIRRICTPVNSSSTSTTKNAIQEGGNNENEDAGSSSKSSHLPRCYEGPIMVKKSLSNHLVQIPFDFDHHYDPPNLKKQNQYYQFNKNETSHLAVHNNQTRRSMSTPPESNHFHHHHAPNHQPIPTTKEHESKPPYGYQPLVQPNHHSSDPLALNNHAEQFDKLGPAGFAINGITSIIQLLHHPRHRHFS